jgi:hypothetical protein
MSGFHLRRVSCILLIFPYLFPISLVFYISFFHSLSSSSPHLTSPSLSFCFVIIFLLFLLLRLVGLSLSPHPDHFLHPEHHDTQNTSLQSSRLREPALYNRSRKLPVVAQPQWTSFTHRSPANGSSNYSVLDASVT